MRSLFLVCAGLLVFPVLSSGQDTAAVARARALVADLVEAKQIPGASVAVARDGVIVWSEGFGWADVEQRVAVTPLTRFRLGSVSKIVTAAAAARLVDAGALDLDAPVQRYVPAFPTKPWPITTRQLTSHTAGIRHYLAKDDAGPLKGNPPFASVTAGLAVFQDDPLLFQPGTGYAYSSYGWNVVAAVVEGASHETFLDCLQRTVLDPLALRAIGPDHVRTIVPFRTRFYTLDRERRLTNSPYIDSSYKWAGGGLLGSAEDLVRFGSAHFQPGFLTQAALDELFTPRVTIPNSRTGVGIGWRIGEDAAGRRVYHHGGSIEGGRAMVVLYPQSKVAIAFLANAFADVGEADVQAIAAPFIR
jgi:serine beta-lactamase-like protein LACTB